MSKRGSIALFAGVLAIALILVGCGGGSGGGDSTASGSTASSTDSSTASLSKAEFIKKADAICGVDGRRTQSEYARFVEKNKISEGKTPTAAQYAEASEKIQIPAFKRQVEEIRALGAPAGEEEQVAALLDAVEAGIEKLEEVDPKVALESAHQKFIKADKLAVAYGLKVCGHSEG